MPPLELPAPDVDVETTDVDRVPAVLRAPHQFAHEPNTKYPPTRLTTAPVSSPDF